MKANNHVQLIGNFGVTPEVKYLENNNAVSNFSLATNHSYKDASGQKIERTNWHRCTAFGKMASLIAEHCKQGSKVLITGFLQTRSWEDTAGTVHYTTEVIIETILFL
jgi:single-strand DNA-binding protein